jgi:hypothetical protein
MADPQRDKKWYEEHYDRLRESASKRKAEAKAVGSLMIGGAAGGAAHGAAQVYLAPKKITEHLNGAEAFSVAAIAAPFIAPGASLRRTLLGPAIGVVGAESSRMVENAIRSSQARKQQAQQPTAFAVTSSAALPGARAGTVLPFQQASQAIAR